jgi:hypothetical protein
MAEATAAAPMAGTRDRRSSVELMRQRFADMSAAVEKDLLETPLASPQSSPPRQRPLRRRSPSNSPSTSPPPNTSKDSELSSAELSESAHKQWGWLGQMIGGAKRHHPRLESIASDTTDATVVPSPMNDDDAAELITAAPTASTEPTEAYSSSEVELYNIELAEMERLLHCSELLLPPAPPRQAAADLDEIILALQASAAAVPPAYAEELEAAAQTEQIVVTTLPVEEVLRRERELEAARIATARAEGRAYRRRQAELLRLESLANDRVAKLEGDLYERVAAERRWGAARTALRERALGRMFSRAAQQLERIVRAQQGHVREKYGTLAPGERAGGRRFSVNWSRVPQPVEVRVHMVRAVKDKLARGRYVVLISMAERLGGRALAWTKVAAGAGFGERPAATRPVLHGGRYYDRELKIEQSVYQLCPSRADLRPSNVYIIELFELAGAHNPIDRVVGWGALPMSDPAFKAAHGRFRVPLIRGEQDQRLHLHSEIESIISEDLGAWLGNVYIEVRPLPRATVVDGALCKEYDVEYDAVNKMLRLPAEELVTRQVHHRRHSSIGGIAASDVLIAGTGSSNSSCSSSSSRDHTGDAQVAEGANSSNNNRRVGKESYTAQQAKQQWWGRTADIFSADHSTATATAGGRESSQRNGTTAAGADSEYSSSREDADSSDIEQGLLHSSQSTATAAQQHQQQQQQQSKSSRWKLRGRPARVPVAPITAVSTSSSSSRRIHSSNNSNSNSGAANASSTAAVDWADVAEPVYTSDDDMAQGTRTALMPGNTAEMQPCSTALSLSLAPNCRRRGEGGRWDPAGVDAPQAVAAHERNLLQLEPLQAALQTAVPVGSDSATAATAAGEDSAFVWRHLVDEKEMAQYSFAVAPDPGRGAKPSPAAIVRHKLRYIRQEVLMDLHPRDWRNLDFWLGLGLGIAAMWARMYLHFLGQWLYLKALNVPVYGFEPQLWCVPLKYAESTVSAIAEVGVVAFGPFFVALCFAVLAAMAWAVRNITGTMPEWISRFIAAFGVGAVLDPTLVFIVDLCSGSYDCAAKCDDYTAPTCECHEGDAWKIYRRLEHTEAAGVTGVFITGIVYSQIALAGCLLLYSYFLYSHMNGRMLDVWRRLNSSDGAVFVPHDFELSAAELQHVCALAKRWLGPGGKRREVVVSNYELEHGSSADTSIGGVTTHVAIYTVELDGSKIMYRHFLRTIDGAILELFSDASATVGSEFSAIEKIINKDSEADRAAAAAGGFFAGMLSAAAAPPTISSSRSGAADPT